jgi:ABC-type uncharacterized transport system permease subunit
MIRIKRSPMAQEIARSATFSYEFALTLIAVGLVVATIFAVLSPEHLAQQLLTVVFLGIIPALLTYLIGFMAYWTLKGASAIYDRSLSTRADIPCAYQYCSYRAAFFGCTCN